MSITFCQLMDQNRAKSLFWKQYGYFLSILKKALKNNPLML